MENAYNPVPYGWKLPLATTSLQNTANFRPVAWVKPLRQHIPQYPTDEEYLDSSSLGSVTELSFKAPKAPDKLKKVATVVGPESTHMVCCDCSSEIDTVTEIKPGQAAYRSGVLLFMLGFVCGCCLIPCCMDTCMDVHHKCPECGVHLGRYQRH